MADSECLVHLGAPSDTALLIFKRNAEKALAKADIPNKPEMATLQALTIYLVCCPFYVLFFLSALHIQLLKINLSYLFYANFAL